MKRGDDYTTRREHLKSMDDEQLKAYFWELAEKIVEPMLKMGYENTSPAIERSVLLRMGFSSIEVKAIVDEALTRNLLAYGAGNIIYRLAQSSKITIREAGESLSRGELWDEAEALFV